MKADSVPPIVARNRDALHVGTIVGVPPARREKGNRPSRRQAGANQARHDL
jgi:hypothetical protein